MRPGLCMASFGDQRLSEALNAIEFWGDLCLDIPTDSTSRLVDLDTYATHAANYTGQLRPLLADHTVTCLSNSRDAQLLLGPHGPQTDQITEGSEAEKAAHAKRFIRNTLRLAHDLEVPHVRLMPGCPDFTDWLSWWGSKTSWEDHITLLQEELDPFVSLAAELGITLLLEPHPKQVIYDPSSATQALKHAPGWVDRVALCTDPANLAAAGHDPLQCVRYLSDLTAAVHVKDIQVHRDPQAPAGSGWTRYGPQPPLRFRTMGMGELPWSAIIAELQDHHFDGVIYIEHEDTLLSRLDGIPRALTQLRRMLPTHDREGRTW